MLLSLCFPPQESCNCRRALHEKYLHLTLSHSLPACAELGLWNFIGTALSVTGLAFTSPTRAGEEKAQVLPLGSDRSFWGTGSAFEPGGNFDSPHPHAGALACSELHHSKIYVHAWAHSAELSLVEISVTDSSLACLYLSAPMFVLFFTSSASWKGSRPRIQRMSTAPSVCAGFLIQLTAVCTPVMAALAGQSIPPQTIAAAIIALAGTCMIALESEPSAITDASLGTCREFSSTAYTYILREFSSTPSHGPSPFSSDCGPTFSLIHDEIPSAGSLG